jgi:ferredoxin-NADP reductase
LTTKPREFQARLVESREIAPEVRHLVLEAPEPFAFTPGQFVYLHSRTGGAPIKRPYSLASAPGGRRFELCLNHVREGVFSTYLFDLEPGAMLQLKGPYGIFGWRAPAHDSVLVATGTGITPFRSMLPSGLPAQGARQVTLLFGVRYERGILFRAEFEDTAARDPRFRFLPTLTRPEPDWRGRTGRVQEHLAEVIGGRRDLDVYICGLFEMVGQVRDLLLGWGFDKHRVIYERYD